jgi:CheY-specific phosphatase CheX
MKAIDSASLAEITINMLERTAMVLAEPGEPGEVVPESTHFARIRYRGPSQGTIILAATDGFLRELAASLLGVEATEVNVEVHGNDALKEMANIVCGSIILKMSGENCQYSLGLPELVKGGELSSSDSAAPITECTVVSEGCPLRVRWQDNRAAKAA